MILAAGQQLLHYRLVGKIGEGAMGVVWRAIDTTLERGAAIKVLPEGFAADSKRLARFRREAKLLASLAHPNIAAVYGFHEVENLRFIAMELVDGEDLVERLERSHGLGLPLDEALDLGRQMAEALEAAHEGGIIHRDLKPANVKIRPDGTVKVLDFGLARPQTPPGSPEAPTLTAELTELGSVMGTALYMSPEQARGMPVDKRTDIWSLGSVLFECLTGRRPFDGASTADVLAAVISEEPDFALLPEATPDFVPVLLRRCLEKDPKRRLRDAGELRIAVEGFQAHPRFEPVGQPSAPSPSGSAAARLVPWGIAAVLGVTLIVSLWTRGEPLGAPAGTTDDAVARWTVPLPPDSRVASPGAGGLFYYSRLIAISRDGSRIAYAVQDASERVELHLREMGEFESRPVAGTAGARAPFFSPDGQWLGFFADDKIKKVALSGGSPQVICDLGVSVGFDASWSPDGAAIVFATDDGLWRVAADGGSAEPLTQPDPERGEIGHHAPRFTADGRHVLFTVAVTPETHLARLSLDAGSWEIISRDVTQGAQLGDGRLVFARSGELLAAEYDSKHHRVAGTAVPVLEGIHTTPGLGGVVLTHFDVSATGTLAYVPSAATRTEDRLLWVDRRGNEELVTSGHGTWVHPRLSPDGQRVSVDIHAADGMRDVYVFELGRRQLNRLTHTGISWESSWRPDGERIAIMSGHPAGEWSLFWAPTDFSGPAELLLQGSHSIPASWSPDGRRLLFYKHFEGGVWSLEPEREEEATLVMRTAARERFPLLSPDGRWIAFVADESGRREVFVQSFPDLGPRVKASIDGGGEPVWSRDGRNLFFRQGDRMLVADVLDEPGFSVSQPRVLFRGQYDAAAIGHQHYDISLDDRRFLMIRHGETTGPSEVKVVLGWSEELRAGAAGRDMG